MVLTNRKRSAAWIWATHHQYTANCYAQFRKAFRIDPSKQIKEIVLCCHCFGDYRLQINDTYIGRKGAPDNCHYPYFETFILNDAIVRTLKKKNWINVIAHNDAVGTHNHPACGGGFWMEGKLEYEDGSVCLINTDDTWQARVPAWWNQSARQMFWTTGYQEEVDLSVYEFFQQSEADIEDETDPVSKQGAVWDWASVVIPGTDPSFFLQKSPVKNLQVQLVSDATLIDAGVVQTNNTPMPFVSAANMMRDFVQLSLEKPLDEPAVLRIKADTAISQYVVFDFGVEMVGFPSVSFSTTGRGALLLGYSECLDERGRVDPTRQGIEQLDTIHFGAGRHQWEMFNRRAFRYMQITVIGEPQEVCLDQVAVNRVYYPVEEKGLFHCDNAALNQVYQISKNTLQCCMNGSFEDCPLRERAQYIGDVFVESVMSFYAFGEYDITRKALLQFAQEQRENGWIPSIVPGSTNHNIVDYLPLFISTAWNYLLYTSDQATIRTIYPSLVKLISYLGSLENKDGLLENQNNWWIFIDWAELGREGVVTALQCLYYQALVHFSRISEACGEQKNMLWAQAKARELRQTVNRYMYSTEAHAYVDCISPRQPPRFSIQTNCIAVLSGVAEEGQLDGCREYLLHQNGDPITTAYFKNYELQALYRLGLLEEFWDGFSYWKEHMKRNTQTWWEVFSKDMVRIPVVSLCHGWGAGPLNLLPQFVAGVTPISPGFQEVLIKPNLFDLEWMTAVIPTPHGAIQVDGTQDASQIRISVAIPKGVMAHIILPSQFANCTATCNGGLLTKQKKGAEYLLDAKSACGEAVFQRM